MRKRHLAVALVLAAPSFALAANAARPQTPAPAPLQVPAGFDIAFAMNALYGNYDAAAGTSISTAPTTGLEYTNFQPGQKVNVKPFFAAASTTGEVFLATFAVPADGGFDCHACAPLIGAAVFVKSGDAWKLEASEKPDIIFGQYGAPPMAQLFQFGPRHTGIELSYTYGGQGVTDSHVIFLVAWNAGFSQAWSEIVSSDNSGYCGAQAPSPCYAYHVELKFEEGVVTGYDDLTVTTTGTDLSSDSPSGVRSVTGVQHLRFSDGKYVPADSH
jgi:hypothetical protein